MYSAPLHTSKTKQTTWQWTGGQEVAMRKSTTGLSSSFFIQSVNFWQTAARLIRHFCRLTQSKAGESLIWPLFPEPIWLEAAILHRGWEGEKPRKSVPFGRGSYSEWTEARFMKNLGRARDMVKACLCDRLSERVTERFRKWEEFLVIL